MTTPRISIVTTVYDRVDCLARCIRSLRHSLYRDFEQIVVADAPSPDEVRAIGDVVASAAHPMRFITLPHRTNDYGHTPAQIGLDAALGEFVCFLSDDNAYLPEHFVPLVAALDADVGLGFVYSSCRYAGRRELRFVPPRGAGIDLGQPLFRRTALVALPGRALPGRGLHAWDWAVIDALMARGVRWQHVDALTFVFRLAAYPDLVEALA